MTIILNGEPVQVADGLTVAGLLEAEGEPAEHVLVELDGELVPPAQYARRVLVEGDRVELILPAFGG